MRAIIDGCQAGILTYRGMGFGTTFALLNPIEKVRRNSHPQSSPSYFPLLRLLATNEHIAPTTDISIRCSSSQRAAQLQGGRNPNRRRAVGRHDVQHSDEVL